MHPDLLRFTADGAGAVPAGLDRIEDEAGVRLCGTRRGRQVEVRFTAGAMVTWVRAAVPDLQALGDRTGGFVLDAGSPAAVLTAFAAVGAAPGLWPDVRVCGGAEGLLTVRRGRPADQPYDLWLLEHLADELGAVTLSPVDTRDVPPPFRSA